MIVHLIQFSKCFRRFTLFQFQDALLQQPDIFKINFLWIEYISIPVNPYKGILLFFKLFKLLFLIWHLLCKKRLCLSVFSLFQKAAVNTVLLCHKSILLLCLFFGSSKQFQHLFCLIIQFFSVGYLL